MGAVAHHQPASGLIALVGEPGDVVGDLGLQRLGQHPPGTLADDLIDQRRRAAGRGALLTAVGLARNYREHGVVPSRPALARRPCLRACSG